MLSKSFLFSSASAWRSATPRNPLSRFLGRELRTGAAVLMGMSIFLSVASISAVSILAGRVEQALLGDAQAALGADRLITSDAPIDPHWMEAAESLGLRAERGASFPSTVTAGDGFALVSVKAVGPSYPMRGVVRLRTGQGEAENLALRSGEAWVDPALLARLGLRLGDTLSLGAKQFVVAAELVVEPDRGMGFMALSPRLMIPEANLAETGLIQLGSRIGHRLWVRGPSASAAQDAEALAAFDEYFAQNKGSEQLETLDDARPEVRSALNRASSFLSVTSMLTLVIASAALLIGARQLAAAQQPRFAVLKTLGASRQELQGFWLRALVGLVLLASVAGLLLGGLIQWGLGLLLAGSLGIVLPPILQLPVWPMAQALALSAGMVLLFAWPAVQNSVRVPAMESLRPRDPDDLLLPKGAGQRVVVLALAAIGAVGLLWLGSRRLDLALQLGLGFVLLGGILWVGLILAYRGLGRALFGMVSALGPRAGFALRSLQHSLVRRAASLASQSVGLTVALAALFLLVILRGDLVDAWGRTIPPDAPNRFLLNVLPEEEASVLEKLARAGVPNPVLFPLVRGRLVEVNGEAWGPEKAADERGRRFLDRELNLSYASSLPASNRVIAGRPLDPTAAEVSVEEGLATSMGLQLGDRVGFDVAGDFIVATITSIREVRWDSFDVNFFFVLSPAVVSGEARTSITSFYVPSDRAMQLGNELLRDHPGLTLVEADALIRQVRGILQQVVAAIQGLFGLSLVAGGLVIWAALLAGRRARQHEARLLRSLGASRAMLLRAALLELTVTGGLAGLIAASFAQGLGTWVAQVAFDLALPWRAALPIWGMLLGAAVSVGAGFWMLRQVLAAPPMAMLRSTMR